MASRELLAALDIAPGMNPAGSLWLLGGLGPPIAAAWLESLTGHEELANSSAGW